MKGFCRLFAALDQTNKTGEKVDALAAYFETARPEDSAWALFFLTGRRFKRLLPMPKLRLWAIEAAGLSEWLFDECYDAVGDLAETLAKVLPPQTETDEETLDEWVRLRIMPLGTLDEAAQRMAVLDAWSRLSPDERFVFNKLLTGAWRVGVSNDLVLRALSKASGVPAATLAHRLTGTWMPSATFFQRATSQEADEAHASKPYPLCLAFPLEGAPHALGDVSEWLAEWKWDGIRSQIIKREGRVFIWSRGEELVTDRYPEVAIHAERLPDGTVLDGELMAWRGEGPLPFAELQRRIGRKVLGKKLQSEVPVSLVAYDILEWQGRDIRELPLVERRALLESVVCALSEGCIECSIRISPRLNASDWAELALERERSREINVEGLMMKRLDSTYRVGRRKGAWWKWKIEPYSVDAVLIYAQRGSGKRASLYTDYTFGIWQGDELVPFAKAYSGLTDEEIRQVDSFVRRNTVEKFGPVRTVKPELVFELGFEGIQTSRRHRSGIAVRFPRILRWRADKQPADADSVDTVRSLLPEDQRGA